MTIDPRVPPRELAGRTLRLFFRDGEICEVRLVLVDIHENCRFGDEYRDLIYEFISSNKPERYEKSPAASRGTVHAAKIDLLERYEVIPE